MPYKYGALAPYISERALRIHHEGHVGGYVTKLNELVERDRRLSHLDLDQLVKSGKGPVFNNAAQIWNHTFFFRCMAPGALGPAADLRALLANRFGTFEKFLLEFANGATGIFGSGWMWLVRSKDNKLELMATKDADVPMRNGALPLMVIDAWEHSYYLDYENRRKLYVETVLASLIDWSFVRRNARLG